MWTGVPRRAAGGRGWKVRITARCSSMSSRPDGVNNAATAGSSGSLDQRRDAAADLPAASTIRSASRDRDGSRTVGTTTGAPVTSATASHARPRAATRPGEPLRDSRFSAAAPAVYASDSVTPTALDSAGASQSAPNAAVDTVRTRRLETRRSARSAPAAGRPRRAAGPGSLRIPPPCPETGPRRPPPTGSPVPGRRAEPVEQLPLDRGIGPIQQVRWVATCPLSPPCR